jgi:ketosteroid isomerase-like protein
MSGAPPALRAAHEYIRRINRREFEAIAELFADDAVFLSPIGTTITGREAIGNFFTTFQPKLNPTVWIVSTVTEGNCCVFELEARIENAPPDAIGMAIDHFTVDDDGKVKRFVMYGRPPLDESAA